MKTAPFGASIGNSLPTFR